MDCISQFRQYELKFNALTPLVGGKDFSRTCDTSTDVVGVVNINLDDQEGV